MLKLDQFILNSAGKFISVEFIKKDGTLRKITGRLGVTKHLKGGTSTLDPAKYIIVYDTVNAGYRAINRDTIQCVTLEGLTLKTNTET